MRRSIVHHLQNVRSTWTRSDGSLLVQHRNHRIAKNGVGGGHLTAMMRMPQRRYLFNAKISCIPERGNTVFTIVQYNILASYLGSNKQPWFLHGIDITPERRKLIFEKFYARSPENELMNRGWPNYVNGILTPEEIKVVEDVDRDIFAWNKRFPRLIDRIETIDSDIVSLVELDRYDDLKEQVSLLGYDSVFVKRPRPSSLDGCCLMWRRNRFDLIDYSHAYLTDRIDKVTGEQIMDRCALAVLLHLKPEFTFEDIGCISPPDLQPIVVVSMHLARNPENDTKDLLRGSQLAQIIDHVVDFTKRHQVEDAPVILCGDVNALNFSRLKGIASAAEVFAKHKLQLLNAFTFRAAHTDDTTVTSLRSMRLDAILYQSSHVDVVISGSINSSDGGRDNADDDTQVLPNFVQPSDHLPIKATMRIKSRFQRGQDAATQWWRVVGHIPRNPNEYTEEDDVVQLGYRDLKRAFRIFLDMEPSFKQTNREILTLGGMLTTLASLGIDYEEASEFISSLRDQGIRNLNFSEFCCIFYSTYARRPSGLDAAFHAVDVDGNGFLDFHELISFFRAFKGTPLEVKISDGRELFQFAQRHLKIREAPALVIRNSINDPVMVKATATSDNLLKNSKNEVLWLKTSKDEFRALVTLRFVYLAGFPFHVRDFIMKKVVEPMYILRTSSRVHDQASVDEE